MAPFEPWHLWVLLGIALILGEMFTAGFFLACFGVAAFVVAPIALFGSGPVFQIFLFSLLSLVCIFTVRPFLLRLSASGRGRELRTGVQALAGKKAKVIEAFGGPGSHGKVRLGGDVWRARGREETLYFAEGDLVFVESVSGVTLVVCPLTEDK